MKRPLIRDPIKCNDLTQHGHTALRGGDRGRNKAYVCQLNTKIGQPPQDLHEKERERRLHIGTMFSSV